MEARTAACITLLLVSGSGAGGPAPQAAPPDSAPAASHAHEVPEGPAASAAEGPAASAAEGPAESPAASAAEGPAASAAEGPAVSGAEGPASAAESPPASTAEPPAVSGEPGEGPEGGPPPMASPALGAGVHEAREEFLAALHRVHHGLPDLPDSSLLKQSPIYAYLVAARLRRDLERSPSAALDSSIDAFLQAHAGEPVSRGLRHAWLASLGERERWSLFLPRAADVTDPALICYRLNGRLAMGAQQGLAEEALARWSLPVRQAPECGPVFAWLRSQGLLTPARLEVRARAALAAANLPLARELIPELPAARAEPLRLWLEMLESPKSSLDLITTTPTLAVEPDALVAGFTRLAYRDAADAELVLPLLLSRVGMTPELHARLVRAAAIGSAYAHLPDAVTRFAELGNAANDPLVAEWRVRAALWSDDYERALAWIEAMPPSLSQEPRWQYWRARAVAAISGTDAAAPLFAAIADTRDYFGYLAADRLHRSYALNMRASTDNAAMQASLAAEPAFSRAHALFDCDLIEEAAAEWSFALASAPPALKIQAARIAARWGWYSQSILTLVQADDWDDVVLRYPRPFGPVVARASLLTQVPSDWILAIMRQESLFRTDAVSHADARGLMQMLPGTAVGVAHRWHLPRPSRDTLFDPTVSVPLGAAYVRELLDHYDQQLGLTLAAYNAGPISVTRWLPSRSIDADIWIENVPYNETRAYVQHVLEHIVAFAAVRAAPPPHLSALLLPVAAAAAAISSTAPGAGSQRIPTRPPG